MKKIILLIVVATFALGCKNKKEEQKINTDKEVIYKTENYKDTETELQDTLTDISAPKVKEPNLTKYDVFKEFEIPKPSSFVFNTDSLKADFSILFDFSHAINYQTTYEKSIALGMYTSDLLYANEFENGNLVTNYNNAIIKLSNELGISGIFSEKEKKLFLDSINFDTIEIIVNNNIHKTCAQLNESKAYETFPFIIYGGWIESVFLLSNTLILNPESPKELYQKLANQKTIIDNLIEFYNSILFDVESFEVSNRIQSIISDLEMLKKNFTVSYKSSDYIISTDEVKSILTNISMVRETASKEPTEKHIQQQEILRLKREE